MADALLGLAAHPLPVVAHILGQTLRPSPAALDQSLFLADRRIHRGLAGKSRWNFDHGLVDQHRHRVEVAGMGFQPQPLRLQRERSTPGKRDREKPGACAD